MFGFSAKISIINCLLAAILADKVQLRGVAQEKLDLYAPKPGNKFTCFSDPSKELDYSAVNDDYCDCSDGSDEPGTSACANSTFHCKNDGYLPGNILSSRVNDGICDPECCDGSDEYNGKTNCKNICQEKGEKERKAQAEKKEVIEKGLKKKALYIKEYESIKSNSEAEIKKYQKLVDDSKLKLEELRKIKEDKEAEEEALKSTKDVSNDNIRKEYENRIEDIKEVASNLQEDIKHLQSILEDLKLNHNQNYHDMAVKGAITAYDEFAEGFKEVDFENDERFAIEKKEETTPNYSEGEETEGINPTQDGDSLKRILEGLTKLRMRVFNYAAAFLSARPAPIDLSNARSQFWDAESKLSSHESDLSKAKKKVEMDFGPSGEYAALNDKCFDLSEGEYTYSICMFGEAHQKSSRGENINLGNFEKWEGSNYSQQIYSGGAYCWNGPQRSVKLFLECGSDEKITEVSEPEKCEYHMRMTSAAACNEYEVAAPPQNAKDADGDKDEL